jgi:RHS repeat-associated protein
MGTLIEAKEDGSGLVFRRNRYYDPQTGRFTQEDPIGLAGGLNQYGFAAGDPVNFSDPNGLCVEDLCIGELLLISMGVKFVTRELYNYFEHRPAAEGMQQELQGSVLIAIGGATLVGGAQVATAGAGRALTADAAATTTAGGATTALASRADAIARLRELGPEAVNALRDFFRTGKLPEGLSVDALQRYRVVAENAVLTGNDKLGVQAERIRMIDAVLSKKQ